MLFGLVKRQRGSLVSAARIVNGVSYWTMLRMLCPVPKSPSHSCAPSQGHPNLHALPFSLRPSYLQIWGRLTRQLIPAVAQQTQLYTMLPVPNPFVVPGARFREASNWGEQRIHSVGNKHSVETHGRVHDRSLEAQDALLGGWLGRAGLAAAGSRSPPYCPDSLPLRPWTRRPPFPT